MHSATSLIAGILAAVAGIALLAYFFYRAVRWAKRGRGAATFVTGLLESIDVGSGLNPAREVILEKRKLKRSEEGAGDPPGHE